MRSALQWAKALPLRYDAMCNMFHHLLSNAYLETIGIGPAHKTT